MRKHNPRPSSCSCEDNTFWAWLYRSENQDVAWATLAAARQNHAVTQRAKQQLVATNSPIQGFIADMLALGVPGYDMTTNLTEQP